jgi:hypothetical protein
MVLRETVGVFKLAHYAEREWGEPATRAAAKSYS